MLSLLTAGQDEVLILGNGPSLLGRPWGAIPRARVFIFGINQSWRVVPDADAHLSIDADQYLFDDPIASGFGGRAYYEALEARRAAFHTKGWANRGVQLDRHDEAVFGHRPFQKRHRGSHVPAPAREVDGGIALKPNAGERGSTCYAALQMVAALPFSRIWMAGLDMCPPGQPRALKFDGARGYTAPKKEVPTDVGAWSNSDRHDEVWRYVPDDVRARVRVIGPSATKVLEVVEWPWPREQAA